MLLQRKKAISPFAFAIAEFDPQEQRAKRSQHKRNMADEDIDSLLEAGIKAAQKSKNEERDPTGNDNDDNSKATDKDNDEHKSRRKSRRSQSPTSRSKSRSRSSRRGSRRSGRDRDRDRRRHSKSRSRSSRRRSSRRSRSRSATRRRGSRRSRRSRSRSPRNDRKRRSRSKSVDKEPRARSTSTERAERAKQRELMELTRDHRTVFVGQLTQKVRERDLEKFFGKIGKIEHVLLIRDKFTNRSKGFAYVEMSNLEDVPKVLILNGQIPDFQVFPIMIKASEAEKNFAAKKDSVMNNAAGAGTGALTGAIGGLGIGSDFTRSSHSAASRIYCGNLHTSITEDDLRCVFQAFGEVMSVTINRDEAGRSKGFGFIQFSAPDEANLALTKGNGLELAGNYLKLGPVNDHHGGGGGVHHAGGGSWKLEDDEGTGLSMNSQSRSALMAKLASGKNIFPTALPTAPVFPVATNAVPAPAPAVVNPALAQYAERAAALASVHIEGTESFCFVIKNMFDVVAENRSGNPDWHLEIKQDVEEECGSYGIVLHSYVEKEKEGGLVYVLFDNIGSAVQAAKVLHGRWFNQRQISVRYLSSQEYVGMFPEARSAVQSARNNSS